MLAMTVEFHEAGERMQEMVDAVRQRREIVVTHFGEPLGTLCVHGPPGEPPRAWLESVVRESLEMMAKEMCRYGILPSSFSN
jgi:antitoxin (DNA-binding transcriptional repressor) of toxin-antitoxin stability system